MTTTELPEVEQFSIGTDDDDIEDFPAPPVPAPGPMSLFVVLVAIATGLAAAVAFQTLEPDTRFVILGGTVLTAAILGIIGLYRYQWFLLVALAIRPGLDDLIADEFGTFQPSAILGILVIVVSLLHLISRRASGNWNKMTPLGWSFVAFFFLFIPSFLTSVDRGVSQGAMFGLASVSLIYLAMEQQLLADRRFVWKMLAATAVGLVVPVVTGYVQFFWTGTLDPGGSGLVRIDGSFAHPNPFATFLAFVLLVTAAVTPTVPVRWRLGAILFNVLTGFLLVATFARGAWAAFLIGSLLLASRVNKKLVFVILGGAAAVGAVVPGVRDRIANLTATTNAAGGVKTDDSLGWRLGYWEKVWPKASDNPLSGIGIDATKTQFVENKDPHNSFLQAIVEGGILGSIGFLAVLVFATIAAWRCWKLTRGDQLDYPTKMFTVGAIAGLFSVAVQLITENVLLNTIVWWYTAIALAHLAALVWKKEPPAPLEVKPRETYTDPDVEGVTVGPSGSEL